MRLYGEKKNPPPTCCCSQALCEKIGYCHDGMFPLPRDEKHCQSFLATLGVEKERRDKLVAERFGAKHHVAPWHFHLRHRERNTSTNKWSLKTLETYKDDDKKVTLYAPPNNKLQDFIEREIGDPYLRGGYNNSLPKWFEKLKEIQPEAEPTEVPEVPETPHGGTNRRKRTAPVTGTGQVRGMKRVARVTELDHERAKSRKLAEDLQVASNKIKGLETKVELLENNNIRLMVENNSLKEENSKLKAKITELEELVKQRNLTLSYDDLKPGGALAKCVEVFTFFPDFECVDAFLEWMNWGDEPGGGLCEDMVRYHEGVSDPIFTEVTEILAQIPYGFPVEVDKGFLIENQCAMHGIVCIRPMKFLEKQAQQSKEDVALTQKIGKTRVVIEQDNAQHKNKFPPSS